MTVSKSNEEHKDLPHRRERSYSSSNALDYLEPIK